MLQLSLILESFEIKNKLHFEPISQDVSNETLI